MNFKWINLVADLAALKHLVQYLRQFMHGDVNIDESAYIEDVCYKLELKS